MHKNFSSGDILVPMNYVNVSLNLQTKKYESQQPFYNQHQRMSLKNNKKLQQQHIDALAQAISKNSDVHYLAFVFLFCI